jgi:hypothetical protein
MGWIMISTEDMRHDMLSLERQGSGDLWLSRNQE